MPSTGKGSIEQSWQNQTAPPVYFRSISLDSEPVVRAASLKKLQKQ
jgi:hypothetical protein